MARTSVNTYFMAVAIPALIRLALSPVSLIIHVIVNILVISPALWVAGRLIAGARNAKFSDAIWIVVLGTVIGAIIGVFLNGLIATFAQLVIWLLLLKHFFETTWSKAFIISLTVVMIFIILSLLLALLLGLAITSIF